MRVLLGRVWRSPKMLFGALAVLLSLMLALPAIAGGDIGATGGPARQAPAQIADGNASAGWSAPRAIEQGAAGVGGAGALYAKSALGLLQITADGLATFWPELPAAPQEARVRYGPAQLGTALPDRLNAPFLFSAKSGFVVIGEAEMTRDSSAAYFAAISPAQRTLGKFVKLPSLPLKVSAPTAAMLGERLYVSDRSGKIFVLDLGGTARGERAAPAGEWVQLPALHSAKTPFASCARLWLVVQYDGHFERLHAFCSQNAERSSKLTGWRWNENGEPGMGTWRPLASGSLAAPGGQFTLVAAQGQSNILAFAARSADCQGASCNAAAEILVYNAVIDRWRAMEAEVPGGTMPQLLAHDTQVHVLANTPKGMEISQFAFRTSSKRFGWIDMSIIAAYLASMVLVGWWFKARNTSTEEFFRGGQSIPWWAAALSIHAALLSSLTYLGLPALVFRTNWIMFMGMLILIPVTFVIALWVMPFFRRIDATSAYEYLSLRFNMPIRQMASALFALFHVGRMAIVLSLAGLALASVTPLDPWQSVLLMGALSIAYSSMGGVEAVVWTEALQTLVLSTGALVCFGFLLNGIDGGFSSYVSQGMADGKFQIVDWNFSEGSWLTFSIWVIILGGIGQNLSTYGADQAVIQRYLVTETEKKAAKAIWLNALTTAPSGIIFFLIGTALYYFYQAHPERLDPSIQIDQIFPAFIASEVPTGAAGLIIAGVFAATQSAVATSMHSISTTMVVDFLRPSGLNWSDDTQLRAARWFTVLVGALGTGIGLIFIDPTIRSLFEAYMAVVGMSMGALGGLFLAGMTTKRVSSLSAFLGLCGGVVIMVVLWKANAINPYLFSAVGVFSCYGLAWLLSFVAGPSRNDLTNLTVISMTRPAAAVRPK